MSTELAIVPKTNSITIGMPSIPTLAEIDALNAMCKIAAYSGFLNSTAPRTDTTQRAADAFFVMMYGRELGIPAMTSLKTIYVIDGKPSCSGQALLALMRKGGMEIELPDPGTVTDSATVKVKRPGGTWKTYTYTKQMAEAARLWNAKDNWKKYPAEMLIWRAVSTAARFEASDLVGGLYTIEELQPDQPVNEQGDPLDMPMISSHNGVASEPGPKSEPISSDLPPANTVEPQPEPAVVEEQEPEERPMPNELFQRLMKDASINAASKASGERAGTIRKLWSEAALVGEYDDMVLTIVERLQTHRKPKNAPPDDAPETEPQS